MNDIDLSKLKIDRQQTLSALTRGRSSRQRWWWLSGAGVLLIAAITWQHHRLPEVATGRVVFAYPSARYVSLEATGYVVARRKAAVASKGTGRLEWLGVAEGSVVKAGTIIARLESRDVEANLAAAQANAAVAAAAIESARADKAAADLNFWRMQKLYPQHYVSTVMYEDAQTRVLHARAALASAEASYRASQANVDYARDSVENTRIRAPFDGVVIARAANVGDIVTPMSSAADAKGAVAVMADMSSLEVDADVAESSLSGLQVGQPCDIALDAFPQKRFRGKVSAIVPTVKRASATVTAKVAFLETVPGILPDMSARVSFLTHTVNDADERPVLAVNPAAITHRDGQEVVFVRWPDQHVARMPVTSGPLLGDVQQVDGSNLHVGDVVVLDPPARLRDGELIQTQGTH